MECQNTCLNAFESSRIRFNSSNFSSPIINCSMHIVNGLTLIFKKLFLCKRSTAVAMLKLITFRNSNIYAKFSYLSIFLSVCLSIYLSIYLPISHSLLLPPSPIGKPLRQSVLFPSGEEFWKLHPDTSRAP